MDTAVIAAGTAARAPGAAAAISLKGIHKWFDSPDGKPLTVLQNIDLAIAPQRVMGLLGPSGCGKSTLLNIISGLLKPDRGQVFFGDVPAGDFTAWRAIGYMFQDERLLPWRTARRNVEFALEAGNASREERRARATDALALVGLERFADAFPHQLSGGMRSRVALARSLITEPRIMLMDEPFSKLDAQTRELMHAELLRIHELKRMTVVFVTHDVEEAVILADDVCVLAPRPGRIRELVPIPCPRPRDATQPEAVALIRKLRGLIGP